jgi:hypothetical protein
MAGMWLYPYMNMHIVLNETTVYCRVVVYNSFNILHSPDHVNINHIIVSARRYIANFVKTR